MLRQIIAATHAGKNKIRIFRLHTRSLRAITDHDEFCIGPFFLQCAECFHRERHVFFRCNAADMNNGKFSRFQTPART